MSPPREVRRPARRDPANYGVADRTGSTYIDIVLVSRYGELVY